MLEREHIDLGQLDPEGVRHQRLKGSIGHTIGLQAQISIQQARVLRRVYIYITRWWWWWGGVYSAESNVRNGPKIESTLLHQRALDGELALTQHVHQQDGARVAVLPHPHLSERERVLCLGGTSHPWRGSRYPKSNVVW